MPDVSTLDPVPLRRRVVAASVAAVAVAALLLAALAALVYNGVWTQARAEALVGGERYVYGTYAWWDEEVDLHDGPTLPLWRSQNAYWSPDDGSEVAVVVFPGEERAFLVSDVPIGEGAIAWRSFDWVILSFSGTGMAMTFLLLWYGAVRLVLGFTPLALPSLLRQRTPGPAMVVSYGPEIGRTSTVVVRVGADTYTWEVRRDLASPQPGESVMLAGDPAGSGWAVVWGPTARLRPRTPVRPLVSADVPTTLGEPS
ncbi:hypothetical protein [Mumia quercus]|uniref:hypothetical protein n=1 Tax=Mumia quercus TaxID=2976125 RepID=UPI0021D13598|nr:hypothetical protein [Mumia quercus]